MPDGSIGHAELGIGDAVLMLAEGYPEEGATVPSPGEGTSVSLNVQVPDADATVRRAVERDAELVRPVSDNPYGRMGIIRDPFSHRWMVMTPPRRATRTRHGDVGYITVTVPDDEPAREFYGAVLGWGFAPGGSARAWQVDGISPRGGLAGTGAAARGAALLPHGGHR